MGGVTRVTAVIGVGAGVIDTGTGTVTVNVVSIVATAKASTWSGSFIEVGVRDPLEH